MKFLLIATEVGTSSPQYAFVEYMEFKLFRDKTGFINLKYISSKFSFTNVPGIFFTP